MDFMKIFAIFIALNMVLLTPAIACEMPFQNITHGSNVINKGQFDKNSGLSNKSQGYSQSTHTLKQNSVKYVTTANPTTKTQNKKNSTSHINN
jgi:hypothetical protein